MAAGRSCPDCFAFRAVTCNGTGANFSSFAQLRRMVRHLAALPSQKVPAASSILDTPWEPRGQSGHYDRRAAGKVNQTPCRLLP